LTDRNEHTHSVLLLIAVLNMLSEAAVVVMGEEGAAQVEMVIDLMKVAGILRVARHGREMPEEIEVSLHYVRG
jgi:hypothetical protein